MPIRTNITGRFDSSDLEPKPVLLWKDVVGVSFSGIGNTVTSTVANWGSAGCASQNKYTYGRDGILTLEFEILSLSADCFCGFSYDNASAHYNTIGWGIYQANASIMIYENGTAKTTQGSTTVVVGDKMKITVNEGGLVSYWKNDTNFYTSATKATAPVLVDVAMGIKGVSVNNITTKGKIAD